MRYFQLYIFFFVCFSNSVFASEKEKNIDKLQFPTAEYIGENTVRIPFKLVDRLIVIEAEIFKQTGNFVVDTGAERLLLNDNHFDDIKGNSVFLRQSGINGSIDNVRIKWLKKIGVKDFSINDVKSHILDLSHIEKSKKIKLFGVIGFNVLKDYEIFIDFYLSQITLFKIDKEGNKMDKLPYLEKITDTLNFDLKKHTIVLKAFVNKMELKLGFDTGAEMNLLDKSVSKKVLKNFKTPKNIVVVGAGKRKIKSLAGKLHKVKLSDNIYCGPMKTVLTNMHDMDKAYGVKLDGVLGYEFMAMRRLIINYKKKQVYFIKTIFYN